jgi:hypothetical protein
MCSGRDARLYMDVLSERKMRLYLEKHLISLGWYPDVPAGSNSGIDILAVSERRKWIIKIKYPTFPQPNPVNTFVSVLGEILQRMEDPTDKFSIAVPDTPPFSRLWKRLPPLAKERTGITALFVNPAGQVREDVI